jgi:prevent-host-death family protein
MSNDVIEKPLSEVKTNLSEIVKLVECDGTEVIVMRHGKPCARIVPFKEPARSNLAGFMRDAISYPDGAGLDLDGMDSAWGEIEADGEKLK